jgi:serine protease Do
MPRKTQFNSLRVQQRAIALATSTMLVCSSWLSFAASPGTQAGAPSVPPSVNNSSSNSTGNLPPTVVRTLPDFTDLVEQVGPSVVNIKTLEKVSLRSNLQDSPDDQDMQELFRRFFGVPFPNAPGANPNAPSPKAPRKSPNAPQAPSEEEQTKGVGSGFILSADGLIMTNAHVVEGADQVVVTLVDKREFKAKIIGVDKRTDVALLKVEASGLPAVKIGDVSKLKVGEWVMAIGSPFGLENTVTAGIVSAKKRDTGDYLSFIQTDVAINPGNSGGPLINMRGEVIGINSQIYSRSGGFMGISFAIPIDEAVRVSDQLRTLGHVQRGKLGIQIEQVNKELAESLGLAKAQGALVRSVEAGSPAEKAGIEPGDIVLRLDGKSIERSIDLPRMVGSIKPGSKVVLSVWRRGANKDISVIVGEFELDKVVAAKTPKEKPSSSGAFTSLGLTVSDLSESQKKELKLTSGVRVEAVADGGLADQAGLREGDIITALANTEVTSVKAFETILSRLDKSRSTNILFRRGDWAQFVIIRPSQK